MSKPRIVFMGTPAFAVPTLRALLAAGYPVSAVFTQPDRPVGRGQKLSMPPVKALAVEHGIPVHQPERLRGNAEMIQTLRELAPDLIIVVAFGQILPREVLDIPRFGAINVHASLLPRFRGAAPIQWALLNGDAETGVDTMLMEEGLDTGPILLEAKTPISEDETTETLTQRLSELGAHLLVETLTPWVEGRIQPRAQGEGAVYAPMIKKDMGILDWAQDARSLHNRIRALQPWPGTSTTLAGQVLKIGSACEIPGATHEAQPGTILALTPDGWQVATGHGVLLVTGVQLPGKKPQSAAEVARGWREVREGLRLGELPS
ncbi:Methionyl-tRNA formyltransferase [compost metagenome]